MGPNWHQKQQQEQMRRQQEEQQRRRQQQMAWQRQQEQEAQAEQVRAATRAGDPFARVEREAARLRREVGAGRMTEEQCKARLKELMVQDERGAWWMVGAETGKWYRHQGGDWVRADPPGRPADPAELTSRPAWTAARPTRARPAESRAASWGLVVPWALANALGQAVGLSLGVVIEGFKVLGPNPASSLAGGAVLGAAVGVAQRLVLRRRMRRTGRWLVLTALAGAVTGWATLMMVDFGSGFVFGLLAGAAQWLVLRSSARRSGWWALASAAATAIGWGLGDALVYPLASQSFGAEPTLDVAIIGFVAGGVGGGVAGALSGIVLARLLRRPAAEE